MAEQRWGVWCIVKSDSDESGWVHCGDYVASTWATPDEAHRWAERMENEAATYDVRLYHEPEAKAAEAIPMKPDGKWPRGWHRTTEQYGCCHGYGHAIRPGDIALLTGKLGDVYCQAHAPEDAGPCPEGKTAEPQRWGVLVDGHRWWTTATNSARAWESRRAAAAHIDPYRGQVGVGKTWLSLEARLLPADVKSVMVTPVNEPVARPPAPTSGHWAERLYSLAQITRALAETDPELVAVATRAAELDGKDVPGSFERLRRCIAVAVDRDEAGAHTRAEQLVERARGRLT